MNFNEIIVDNLEILLDKTIPFIRKALIDEIPKNSPQNGFFFDKLDGKIETEIFDMIQHPLDPSGIKCSSLIIGSELDNYAPLWMSKKLAQEIENSRLEIIPMTGHFGPSHRAGAYNTHILKFLRDLNILSN
jgi:pimeloyl-ACP methyl ester carboxylesterase